MRVCTKCGAEISEKAYICPNCGEEFFNKETYNMSNYEFKSANTVVSVSQRYSGENSKIMLIFSYLSFFVVIPLLCNKNSNFSKFHINQGFALFISEVLYAIACYLMNALLMEISEWLYPVVAVMIAGSIIFVVFSIFGIASVLKGEKRELPLIGQFKFMK